MDGPENARKLYPPCPLSATLKVSRRPSPPRDRGTAARLSTLPTSLHVAGVSATPTRCQTTLQTWLTSCLLSPAWEGCQVGSAERGWGAAGLGLRCAGPRLHRLPGNHTLHRLPGNHTLFVCASAPMFAAYWTRRSTLGLATGLGVGAAFALGGYWIQVGAGREARGGC